MAWLYHGYQNIFLINKRESIIGVGCLLGGNRNEGLGNVVGPEDVQYFQRCHHENHKPVTKHQHLCLKIIDVPTLIRAHPECWHNAHWHKQDDPATYPGDKCMYVYDVQH